MINNGINCQLLFMNDDYLRTLFPPKRACSRMTSFRQSFELDALNKFFLINFMDLSYFSRLPLSRGACTHSYHTLYLAYYIRVTYNTFLCVN